MREINSEDDSRVSISENAEFTELDIDGVYDGSVAIGHSSDTPRVIVQIEDVSDIELAMDEGETKTYTVRPLSEDFTPPE